MSKLVGSPVFSERLTVNVFRINMEHLEKTQQRKPDQHMLYFWKPNSGPTKVLSFIVYW